MNWLALFFNITNMQTKTINTPFRINLFFLAFLLLPLLFGYGIYEASAKTITFNYCDKLFNESPFVTIDRQYTKLCNNRFQFLSNKLKRQFINQYNNIKYDLQK